MPTPQLLLCQPLTLSTLLAPQTRYLSNAGAIGAWLYSHVLGVSQAPGTAAWSNPLIWPRNTNHEMLPYATGFHKTIRGNIQMLWNNLTATAASGLAAPVDIVPSKQQHKLSQVAVKGATHPHAAAALQFQLQVVLPTNVAAEVRIPLPYGVSAAAVTVTEGGNTVFTNGAYVPGVAGITGAAPTTDGTAIAVMCGGGGYSFLLAA